MKRVINYIFLLLVLSGSFSCLDLDIKQNNKIDVTSVSKTPEDRKAGLAVRIRTTVTGCSGRSCR